LLASLLMNQLQHVSNQKSKIGEKDWLKHVMSRSFVTKNVGFKKKSLQKPK